MIVDAKQVVVKGLTFEPFITHEEIQETVQRMAFEIDTRFEGRDLIIVAILNGAYVFAADLMRALHIDPELQFVKLSSYEGLSSSGQLSQVIGLPKELEGKDVLVIEDIIDSGFTVYKFMEMIRKKGVRSVELASLFVKPDKLEYPLEINYSGFEIPPDFVIGYGMDYDGKGRGLRDLYRLKSD